jgi:hypothetical protein
MSFLGWFNYIVVQWFCFRISYYYDKNKIKRWGILFPVKPLSGWGKFMINAKFYRIKK